LKILITNALLDVYAGTQVVVRDLSLELRRQGHVSLVYSPKLGAVAEEIRSCGVEVTADISRLSLVPDVIHGHHHSPVMDAMLRFPSTPAIFVCHAAEGFVEEPLYFPRILRYFAVDHRCRKRLEGVPGIPRPRIEVVLNAVDLTRFQPRGPLPSRPARALVFSNNASRSTHLPAVRRACRQAGLELDVLGHRARSAVANPESILPRYDIVFAKARCALEAMAVGNAVVLCDFPGVGPLVTSENFDRLRPMNFGAGVLVNPLEPEYIRAEIERYDAKDASEVCRRVRTEAGLVETVDRWVRIYTDVIEEFRCSGRDVDEEFRVIGDYLHRWSFGRRVDWEREQLLKLARVPFFGNGLLFLARRLLRKWTDGYGLNGNPQDSASSDGS